MENAVSLKISRVSIVLGVIGLICFPLSFLNLNLLFVSAGFIVMAIACVIVCSFTGYCCSSKGFAK